LRYINDPREKIGALRGGNAPWAALDINFVYRFRWKGRKQSVVQSEKGLPKKVVLAKERESDEWDARGAIRREGNILRGDDCPLNGKISKPRGQPAGRMDLQPKFPELSKKGNGVA